MPPAPTHTDRPRRSALPLVLIALLLAGLAIAGVLVVRQAATSPSAQRTTADSSLDRDGEPSATPGVPSPTQAALDDAQVAMKQQEYTRAISILLPASQRAPEDDAVRVLLAQCYLAAKQYAEAYTQYEAAIAIVSRTSPAKSPLPPPPGGEAGATSPDAPTAGAAALARRDPKLAQLHFEAGTVAVELAKLDRASEHYWTAQAIDPAEARYPLYLAMVQIRRGEEAAGGASLLRAVKLQPDLPEAWGTLAELELKNNRLNVAAQHLERVLALQPDEPRWRMVQARILNRQDKPEQAATVLLALPADVRVRPPVLALLSESYGLLARPQAAADAYAAAFKQASDNPEFAYQAALWYERAKDRDKARVFAAAAGMMGHDDARKLEVRLAAP